MLHCRLRGGKSHAAGGGDSFRGETFARVRAGGVTRSLSMRAASGFYSKKMVTACQKAGASWSITVKLYPNIHAAISTIAEQACKPIPYRLDGGSGVS